MSRITTTLAIAFAALLMLVSCASTDPLRLVPSPDKNTQTYIQGSTALSAKNDRDVQMIVGTDNYDGGNVGFIVSIADSDNGSFNFRDDNISLYGGNKDRNSWKLIATWDSASFIKSQKRQAGVALLATGIIGTIAVIDAILNPDSAADLVLEIATDTLLFHSDIMDIQSSLYVSGDPSVMLAASAIEAGIAINQLSSMYEAENNNYVLQVPVKTSVSAVSGKVLFNNIPKYPDYKLVFDNGKQDMEFVFSRTDREEIINPWKDRSTSIFAINYSYTYGLDRHNITMHFLEPKYLGVFAGVALSPVQDDLLVGLSIGTNCKISDYSWISGGIEVRDINCSEDDVTLLGSLGVNICANMVSLYGGAVYTAGKIYGEVGAGIAF